MKNKKFVFKKRIVFLVVFNVNKKERCIEGIIRRRNISPCIYFITEKMAEKFANKYTKTNYKVISKEQRYLDKAK